MGTIRKLQNTAHYFLPFLSIHLFLWLERMKLDDHLTNAFPNSQHTITRYATENYIIFSL